MEVRRPGCGHHLAQVIVRVVDAVALAPGTLVRLPRRVHLLESLEALLAGGSPVLLATREGKAGIQRVQARRGTCAPITVAMALEFITALGTRRCKVRSTIHSVLASAIPPEAVIHAIVFVTTGARRHLLVVAGHHRSGGGGWHRIAALAPHPTGIAHTVDVLTNLRRTGCEASTMPATMFLCRACACAAGAQAALTVALLRKEIIRAPARTLSELGGARVTPRRIAARRIPRWACPSVPLQPHPDVNFAAIPAITKLVLGLQIAPTHLASLNPIAVDVPHLLVHLQADVVPGAHVVDAHLLAPLARPARVGGLAPSGGVHAG
mmetsp:Transcript_14117/g.38357  ORF Transcript_14117/g.38357 Transcript_14117/m.38357 type:complete len:323 (+) Transcript_14117:1750-2718(+)